MNEIQMLFYGLWTYMVFSGILLAWIAIRTPAFTFLKGQIFRRPVTMIITKSGMVRWSVPKKVEEGWAYFKRGKQELGYILSRMATMRTGANEIGMILEEKGGYIPPRLFTISKKLYSAGFNNYTEAEIAFHLYQIEKEYGIAIQSGKEVKVTDPHTGKDVKMPVMRFVEEELRERGINKFLDPQDEIRNVVHENKHNRIKEYIPDFTIMEQFFKYSMNPAAVSDKISAERMAEREKMQLGLGGKINKEAAMAFLIIFVAIAFAYVIVYSTGGMDWIIGMLQGGGGAAPAHTSPSLPKPPIDIG